MWSCGEGPAGVRPRRPRSAARRGATIACLVAAGGTALPAQAPARRAVAPEDLGGVIVAVSAPPAEDEVVRQTGRLLETRMAAALDQGGFAAVARQAPFTLAVLPTILEETVVDGGLEPRTYAKVDVGLVVRHEASGAVVASRSWRAAGAGDSRTAALRQAIAALPAVELRAFGLEARQRIVGHYDAQCDAVLAAARAMAARGARAEAVTELATVPVDARRCHGRAMTALASLDAATRPRGGGAPRVVGADGPLTVAARQEVSRWLNAPQAPVRIY